MLHKKYKIYLFLAVAACLSGCLNEDRRGQKIVQSPKFEGKTHREASINMLTEYLNTNGENSEVLYKRALLYLEGDRTFAALTDIDRALELKDGDNRYFLVKALCHRALSDLPKALLSAIKAEGLGNKTPELFTLLGDLYQQSKQYGKANTYLAKSLQASPNNGETYYYMAQVMAKNADTLNSIVLLEKSVALKPSFLPTYIAFSDIYTNLRQYPLALNYSKTGLNYHPQNGELYWKRGTTYQRLFKGDSAILCYQEAIKFNPSLYQASLSAANMKFKWRDYRGALPFFLHTYQKKPDVPNLMAMIGMCYEFTGDLVKAEEFYTAATTKNPQDYLSMNGYWRVKRKQLYGDSTIQVPEYVDQPGVSSVIKAETRRIDSSLYRMPTLEAKRPKLKIDSLPRRLPIPFGGNN
jgi:tetratricopeptide (TPR) repeat protein